MTIHQHRRRVEHVCPACHKPFTGLTTARTCSDACRKKISRQKAKNPPEAGSGGS